MDSARHARIKAIFLQACDLEPRARAAFVAQTCGADTELRDAVMDLVASDERPFELVDRAASGMGARLLAFGMARVGELDAARTLPERIGRYRILRVLGEGGMGTVYEAEQDVPKRRVAVKVIRGGMGSAGVMRRFEHEAELLGRLNHPGIAHVYEAGVDDGPGSARPFCAMELVEGDPLTDAVRTRGMNLTAKLELFALVCDAVQHAHQHGVLHRDLKPGNILVDRSGQPKVLDFGVARLLEDEPGQATLTVAGAVIGTLAYMSPEQVSGGGNTLDARADVYALGVVGYELLCGRLPYDVLDTPIPAAARTICEVEPTPLGAVDRELRGDLQTILATALAKDRSRRYASAGELAADVRRFMHDEPIVARPASTLYQLRKFARRNRTFVAGVVVAVLALIVGTVVSAWLAHKHSVERERADSIAAEAERETYRASVLAAGLALEQDNPRFARSLLAQVQPVNGGWELERLRRATAAWLAEVDPGVDLVWHVAFERGSDEAVAVGMNGAVATWNTTTGAHALRLAPAQERSSPRALSQDGSLCLSLKDGTPFVWSTATGKVVKELRVANPMTVHERNMAAFSPDMKHAAVCDVDRGTFLFDLESDADPVELRLGKSHGGVVAFSGDNARVATTQYDIPVVWNVATRTVVKRFEVVRNAKSVALDQDGRRFAVGNLDSVHLLDVENGALIRKFEGHPDHVTSLCFSPDGASIAAMLEDGSLWLWDCASGEVRSKGFVGRPSWKTTLAWSADGTKILTGTHLGRSMRLWDAGQARDPEVLRDHKKTIYPVVYTPDGTRIASGSWDHSVRIWSAATGRSLAVLRAHRTWVADLAASPDNTRLASVSTDNQLIVWSLETGALIAQSDMKIQLKSVAWSRDGTRIAVGQAAGPFEVVVLDAGTLAPQFALAGHKRAVNTVTFDAAGKRLVSGADDGSARLWDLDARRNLVTRGPIPYVYCARYSPDGRALLLAGNGGFLELVDAGTLERIRSFVAHPREVFGAGFSPDGTRIFSGGRDGRLCVWDVASGDLVGQFSGHGDFIWGLAVSPDGVCVATGSGDATVRQWESCSVAASVARRTQAETLRAEAQPIVEGLFARSSDANAVAASLHADRSLRDELRAAALLLVLEQSNLDASRAGTAPAPR